MSSFEKGNLEDASIISVDASGTHSKHMLRSASFTSPFFSQFLFLQQTEGNTDTTASGKKDTTVTEAPAASAKEDAAVAEAPAASAKWTAMVTTNIHRPILTALHAVTSKAVSNPRRTIGAVAVLSLLLFAVGLFTNFNIDVDDDTVWTPSAARPVQHSKWRRRVRLPCRNTRFSLDLSLGRLGQDEVKRVL
jgi:hypothetical protein